MKHLLTVLCLLGGGTAIYLLIVLLSKFHLWIKNKPQASRLMNKIGTIFNALFSLFAIVLLIIGTLTGLIGTYFYVYSLM